MKGFVLPQSTLVPTGPRVSPGFPAWLTPFLSSSYHVPPPAEADPSVLIQTDGPVLCSHTASPGPQPALSHSQAWTQPWPPEWPWQAKKCMPAAR